MVYRRLASLAVLGTSLSWALASAQDKPPTLDPTYGMPIPKKAAEVKLGPDATWIWSSQVADQQTIYLRKNFDLKSKINRAMLYVTADNQFTAYVNGQKVGVTPTDPNDDSLWARVQAFDVTALIKSGANAVAVQAYNAASAAGVLVRLEVDGKPVLLSGKDWKVTEAAPSGNWTDAGYDDSAWKAANEEGRVGTSPWGDNLHGWPVPITATPNYLFHLPIQPVRWAYAGDPDGLEWHDASSHLNIDRPSDASGQSDWKVVFDFGKELSGRVLTQGSTAGLTIGTGESPGEAMEKPWTSSVASASPYTALRYAALTVPAADSRANFVVFLDHLYYPVKYRGSFDCSDPLLTKVWYTGAYTSHLCMQQDIWDAPKRDRARWMGDLHVSGEVIDNVFADKFLMEQTISRLRADAQGGKPATSLPNQHVNGIPGYSCAWIAGLADLYRHIDDKEYIQSQHDALVSLLEFCRQEFDDQGVFVNKHGEWPFTDWSPGFDKDTPLARATTHLFLVKAVKEAVFLFHELGDEANATKYAQWADQLDQQAQAHLVSEDGTFSDRKQENAMAIYSGVATQEQTAHIFDKGIFKPETEPTDLDVSPYYGNYVLRAMAMSNHLQDGLDYIRSFWGQMIKEGATTFYEGYDPFWDKHNFHSHLQADDGTGYFVSLCHGWSCGPTNFLTEYVLGIQSTGAGFKTCTISPNLGDLTWASGVVPTPHGDIKVRADKMAGGLSLNVTVPKGVSAKVILPTTITKIDGKPASGSSVDLGPGSHILLGS
jgi:hypothetical protein